MLQLGRRGGRRRANVDRVQRDRRGPRRAALAAHRRERPAPAARPVPRIARRPGAGLAGAHDRRLRAGARHHCGLAGTGWRRPLGIAHQHPARAGRASSDDLSWRGAGRRGRRACSSTPRYSRSRSASPRGARTGSARASRCRRLGQSRNRPGRIQQLNAAVGQVNTALGQAAANVLGGQSEALVRTLDALPQGARRVACATCWPCSIRPHPCRPAVATGHDRRRLESDRGRCARCRRAARL